MYNYNIYRIKKLRYTQKWNAGIPLFYVFVIEQAFFLKNSVNLSGS